MLHTGSVRLMIMALSLVLQAGAVCKILVRLSLLLPPIVVLDYLANQILIANRISAMDSYVSPNYPSLKK